MMVRHTNAGASDLDRALYSQLGSIPALEDSLYLSGIDLEWLYRLAKKNRSGRAGKTVMAPGRRNR